VRWNPAAAAPSDLLRAIDRIGYTAWPYDEDRLALVDAAERRSFFCSLAKFPICACFSKMKRNAVYYLLGLTARNQMLGNPPLPSEVPEEGSLPDTKGSGEMSTEIKEPPKEAKPKVPKLQKQGKTKKVSKATEKAIKKALNEDEKNKRAVASTPEAEEVKGDE
jgi:hypothetical protein